MFFYSPKYQVNIGRHVFRVEKYDLLYEKLTREEKVSLSLFDEPEPLTESQILTVHTYDYLNDLLDTRVTERTRRSELPMTKEIVRGFFLNSGGTLAAAREALKTGWAMNLGGGFHHAYSDHAEGFCYLNDVAIAARTLLSDKKINRALICDLDLHQGNGTARIFQEQEEVFTFSMHQQNLYPPKEKSDLDLGLPDGVDDEEYLDVLGEHLPRCLDSHKPDIILYLAGADPYEHDQLGKLKLTIEGLRHRDRFVISQARQRNIPIAVMLAGGYAFDIRDTVLIHLNTCRELQQKPE
jgi:acetoin utilization deacetylase AcuC-like enzyme